MTIQSHLESAEESLRQALINSISEKQDTNLTDIFHALNTVKNIIRLVSTNNTGEYKYQITSHRYDDSSVSYNLSDYTNISDIIGDNVITFNTVSSINSPDKISLGLD